MHWIRNSDHRFCGDKMAEYGRGKSNNVTLTPTAVRKPPNDSEGCDPLLTDDP